MIELFAMQVEAAGKKFVYQVVVELDKNHRANDQPNDSPGEGRMYKRPESPYCPVKTFELYLSKLNPAHACGKGLGRKRRIILAILMKSGIEMCPSEKIR